MADIIYSAIMSLDGYTADTTGGFDWAAPSEEVHAFVNDRERVIGTYLYGRRMYETMRVWQTMPTGPDESAAMSDYAAIWKAADKVVYSSTLSEASTPRTRIERRFEPDAVRSLAASADRAVSVGGPTLAVEAFRAGLVDEVQLFVVPVSVGGGTPALPHDLFVRLELRDEHRFADGTVYLDYGVLEPR
ncbi:dihydrofolate reductase family protein [Leifsonia poae]|uniref:Deaminase n=1 Tax=Leifsonia poae TaxID=110933 RepID=A0A9W6LZQ3_9MICO|nr:dihydrofolate reductase family protein [Leifsonia poae]GLJ75884.1 deaminase [Leifsonia poae]